MKKERIAKRGEVPPKSGIYMFKNTKNGKVYIGLSNNIRLRFNLHVSRLRKGTHFNKHLQNAWDLYGERSFKITILEFVLENQLEIREQYWMDYYQSYDPKFGYNISPISNRTTGYHHTEEARKKISLALAKRIRKPYSRKQRKRMSEISMGVAKGLYSTNTSGFPGVYWDNTKSRWVATLYRNKKRLLQKYFHSKDEAIKAVKEAEKLFNLGKLK